jgi:hypothetical protein
MLKKSNKPVSTPYTAKKQAEESSSEDSSSEEEAPAKPPVKGWMPHFRQICVSILVTSWKSSVNGSRSTLL